MFVSDFVRIFLRLMLKGFLQNCSQEHTSTFLINETKKGFNFIENCIA